MLSYPRTAQAAQLEAEQARIAQEQLELQTAVSPVRGHMLYTVTVYLYCILFSFVCVCVQEERRVKLDEAAKKAELGYEHYSWK